MAMVDLDILLVSDPRFTGGTSAALLADVAAFRALDLRVGLMAVDSGFFARSGEPPNPAVLALFDAGVVPVPDGQSVRAQSAFFHHPMAFRAGLREGLDLRAGTAVLVAHHPCFRGDGSLEYNPVGTAGVIRRQFGVTPVFAPVSGVVRQQLASFAPLIRLTAENWINVFDVESWTPRRPVFSDAVPVVGRHGRPDALKWPDRPEDVVAPLTPGPDWRTRLMGVPERDLAALGVDLTPFEVVGFGEEPVPQFLDSLDVFAFFHHARWVEAFGRTVAEAMLMARPCVLDRRMQPTFGPLAYYCRPAEAPALMERLRAAPLATRARAERVREVVRLRYSAASVAGRLARLEAGRGRAFDVGPRAQRPHVVLRKVLGLMRRSRAATPV
ncbi:glycosyltransferase family 1 protein [Celeribacter indicus]|uniref:Putative glycosyltransferase n=1 Tax=Celeribacter indicus TaxID=1208324 RepID=A0A0B5E626_9RHOB|nr:glycosyltransferase family 1 protein [Celeribacter indicus]AJE47787.1 putative glycosyltransferase [Celeribacter indicus]SDW22857.1 Glycosyltransferase involved in cell wall bisynthesis [Celeribacter indicus]